MAAGDTATDTSASLRFSFLKGSDDVVAPKDASEFEWDAAAASVRESLGDAMNARNVAFLIGSGCSSLTRDEQQLGIPTMQPMANTFIDTVGESEGDLFLTATERAALQGALGLNLADSDYASNLESLMEVLYSFDFALQRSGSEALSEAHTCVKSAIGKLTAYLLNACTTGPFASGDESVVELYSSFFRKLVYRDRALPRPWLFTTNYDLFCETALDRLGIPYSNGFSGTVERRFNPATFRYSLAEQLDITSRKWTAVDGFLYLCKLHGSISWVEETSGLFPIRELQGVAPKEAERVLIYPTPAKQNATFASPYSDLFREFQSRIVREQSVLFVLGYSFSDQHVNNIIFQALTIPTFRLVSFVPLESEGVVSQLRALNDPRIWLIGGDGPVDGRKAHYFDTIIEKFLPEPPGAKVDTAIESVLRQLVSQPSDEDDGGGSSGV